MTVQQEGNFNPHAPSATQWGVAATCAFVALACAVFALRSEAPRLEHLSQHQITPTDFGMFGSVRARVSQSEPTLIGYAFVIPKGSVPHKYDKGTDPAVSEPAVQDLRNQYLFLHPVIGIDEARAAFLKALVGTPLEAWFYQGKIIALANSEQVLIDVRQSEAGFSAERMRWWLYTAGAMLTGLFTLCWQLFRRALFGNSFSLSKT